MSTPDLVALAPAELEELVLDALRTNGGPRTVRSVANAVARRQSPARSAADVHRLIGAVLTDLVDAGRVTATACTAGGAAAYAATYATADLERRILALTVRFGGRPATLAHGSDDAPLVTVTAPLELLEAVTGGARC